METWRRSATNANNKPSRLTLCAIRWREFQRVTVPGATNCFRAVRVLADYAEVPEAHEGAIEQYLRDELEYVVVETFDHARAGVSLLREEVGGRATFFVDSTKNLTVNEYEPIIPFRAEDGVYARLDKLVEFRDPLGPAAKQFLPRLRAAYLTDSAVGAEKLARENPQYAFVTPDGTTYQGRMVTGGGGARRRRAARGRGSTPPRPA